MAREQSTALSGVFDIYSGSILQNFHTKYEDIEYKAKYRARITRDGKFAVWVKEQDGTLKLLILTPEIWWLKRSHMRHHNL